MSGSDVQKLIQRQIDNSNRKNNTLDEEEVPDSEPSKFIIPPYSYWNMQWNNFTNVVFVFWIFYAPVPISSKTTLDLSSLNILLIFDIIFMLERILDLFAGFHKPDGTEETRLIHVVY